MTAKPRISEKEIQDALRKLTPEMQGVAKTIAGLKLENKMLSEALARVKEDHGSLWELLVVILIGIPKKELRIPFHAFPHFKEEYRVAQWDDEEKKERVYQLKTLTDKD